MKRRHESFQDWPGAGQQLDLSILKGRGPMTAQGRSCAASLRDWGPRDPFVKDDLMHVSNKHLLKIGHEDPYDREVARNSVKLLCYKMLQQHLVV